MLGTASKYFAGISLLLIAAAVVYGIGTGGDSTGNVALLGTAVLGTSGAIAGFLAFVMLEAGDSASQDRHRQASYELLPAYWPAMLATGIGVLIVGLVINTQLAIFGQLLIITAALEWTLTAWADHRSTDSAANYSQRRTLATPFEVPLYGAVVVALPVFLISRVLIAVSRNAASWFALAAATVVLGAAFLLYAKPQLKKALVTSVLAISAVALIVGGVVAAAIGERDIEHHGPEGGDHSEEEVHEEGLAPFLAVVELS
ncbi:MAG: hypothetical protein P8N50_00615 [Actinomycetota bacterium]|jgi:hypothetical protein|nr:hypothetical protein [Actinomycetota bacterium]